MNTEAIATASAVSQAVEHLGAIFEVTSDPTGDGGAIVTVHGVEIGDQWNATTIDLTFEVAFNYPFAPIYPYFTTPDLARAGGSEIPPGLQRVEWRGAQRTQISLRANRWNPQGDTAVGAVMQVQRWLQSS